MTTLRRDPRSPATSRRRPDRLRRARRAPRPDRRPVGDEPYLPEPPRPINWNLLTAEEAQTAWLELDAWVDWLRRTYGLPAAIIPPAWHRHPELVWELSALHLHWLGAYDPEQHGSAPIGWHRDFADARERLRDWVATCGTNLGRDRPTRQTIWPGEPPDDTTDDEVAITNRREDFLHFISDDVQRRRESAPAARG